MYVFTCGAGGGEGVRLVRALRALACVYVSTCA